MMRAVEIKGKALHPTRRPLPRPGRNEVLIRVHAAGINRPDILQRRGHYPPPPGITDIPGLEVAGVVVESRSAAWKKGDRVCALLAGGGYAEFAVAPAGQCLPLPRGLKITEAAALPEGLFTIWNNLFLVGGLRQDEIVLIHGGASGIGTLAIQMAVAAGAYVIVTAGSARKCAACLSLGADLAINYKTHDFVREIEAACGSDGIDLVLDMVGGSYVARSLSLLAPGGRHVSIAYLTGARAEIDLPALMKKRLVLTGSTLRARPLKEKAALARGISRYIWPLVKKGLIRPVIFKTFPLSRAADAHRALEKGDHIGKIILKMV